MFTQEYVVEGHQRWGDGISVQLTPVVKDEKNSRMGGVGVLLSAEDRPIHEIYLKVGAKVRLTIEASDGTV